MLTFSAAVEITARLLLRTFTGTIIKTLVARGYLTLVDMDAHDTLSNGPIQVFSHDSLGQQLPRCCGIVILPVLQNCKFTALFIIAILLSDLSHDLIRQA